MIKRFLFCGALLAAPVLAHADDDVGHFYLNPQAGWLITDHKRDTKDDWLYGLGLGYNISQHWSAQLNWNEGRVRDRFDSGNLKLDALTLDMLAVFNRGAPVAPYLTFGLGDLRQRPSLALDSDKIMPEAGAGLMLKLWQSSNDTATFSLRPEIKARWSDQNFLGTRHLVDYMGLVGFQFSFGPGKAPPPPPAPLPAPPPPAAATPAPPPPPVTPAAPLDSDHDGVPDSVDRCPNTPPGVAVDQFGCPQQGSITLEGVNFATNSDQLTEDSRPILDTVADGLRKHPRLRVEVQGHTDSTGAPKYNLSLSQRRAESVRDYLVSRQVPAQQLVAKGYGQTQPVASNTTKEGKARNRRVVMLVLENPGDVKVEGQGTAELK